MKKSDIVPFTLYHAMRNNVKVYACKANIDGIGFLEAGDIVLALNDAYHDDEQIVLCRYGVGFINPNWLRKV